METWGTIAWGYPIFSQTRFRSATIDPWRRRSLVRRRRCSSARPFALLRGGEKLRARLRCFGATPGPSWPSWPKKWPKKWPKWPKAEALGSELLVLKRESKRCGQSEGSAWQDWQDDSQIWVHQSMVYSLIFDDTWRLKFGVHASTFQGLATPFWGWRQWGIRSQAMMQEPHMWCGWPIILSHSLLSLLHFGQSCLKGAIFRSLGTLVCWKMVQELSFQNSGAAASKAHQSTSAEKCFCRGPWTGSVIWWCVKAIWWFWWRFYWTRCQVKYIVYIYILCIYSFEKR